MKTLLFKKILPLKKSLIMKNSFWGLTSNLIQNLFLSLFFLIMARQYSTDDFAQYLIANTLYQFVAAFSALGLGQWFIREVVETDDKTALIHRFLKTQFAFGALFFFVNVVLALLLYESSTIHVLSVLLGLNVVFDNLIYAVKHVNIAEYTQKNSFLVLCIEAVSKFFIGCLLFVFPLSIITLSVILITLRFITLNLFLRMGSTGGVKLTNFWSSPLSYSQLKDLLLQNWAFVVIGSVSIIYWRIGSIIVSKTLGLADVANYEISIKLFTMAQLLPVVVSATVFPKLSKLYSEKRYIEFKALYKKVFLIYLMFGLFTYSFIYSFADVLLPFAFGDKYAETALYTKQIFLTILVFPTALLQANVLVAIKLEKVDMTLNIISLLLNVVLCFVGLYFLQSLLVINLAIFSSFVVFHLAQDVVLLKKNISSLKEILTYCLVNVLFVSAYIYTHTILPAVVVFAIFWIVTAAIVCLKFRDFSKWGFKAQSNKVEI